MTTSPYGRPAMPDQRAIMPMGVNQTPNLAVPLGVPLSLISVTANGTPTVSVTCSVAHGLSTDSQISVEGLANGLANGFFSVVVTGAMSFTYQTYAPIPADALLTSGTRMVTAKIGLPRGYTSIEQVGP